MQADEKKLYLAIFVLLKSSSSGTLCATALPKVSLEAHRKNVAGEISRTVKLIWAQELSVTLQFPNDKSLETGFIVYCRNKAIYREVYPYIHIYIQLSLQNFSHFGK